MVVSHPNALEYEIVHLQRLQMYTGGQGRVQALREPLCSHYL